MQQLKDMLNGMSGKAKSAPQPAKPVQAAPQPKVQPAPAQPAAEPEKSPGKGCTERRRGVAAGGVCQRAGRPGNAAQKAGEKVYFPDVRHSRGRKARCPQAGKKRIP